jgi:hypothetical protein
VARIETSRSRLTAVRLVSACRTWSRPLACSFQAWPAYRLTKSSAAQALSDAARGDANSVFRNVLGSSAKALNGGISFGSTLKTSSPGRRYERYAEGTNGKLFRTWGSCRRDLAEACKRATRDGVNAHLENHGLRIDDVQRRRAACAQRRARCPASESERSATHVRHLAAPARHRTALDRRCSWAHRLAHGGARVRPHAGGVAWSAARSETRRCL